MNHAAEVWTVIVVALIAANLPFVNERLLVVGPRRAPKALGWRVLELLLLLGAVLGLGFLIEGHLGRRQEQGWQFYAAMGCLFLTFAFPGFIWRYLRRGGGREAAPEA
jgi:hypothetical protein